MKLRGFIKYSMFFGLVIFALLAMACGGARETNNSSSKMSAPSNANSSSNANSTDENANPDSIAGTKPEKVTLETADNDAQIRPAENAVLENGRKAKTGKTKKLWHHYLICYKIVILKIHLL